MEVDRFTIALAAGFVSRTVPVGPVEASENVAEAYGILDRSNLGVSAKNLIQRKLFLCHVVNSDVVVNSSEERWKPFHGMYRLERSSLLHLVKERNLWRYLIELVCLAPPGVALAVVGALQDDHLGTSGLTGDVALGLAVAVVSRARLTGGAFEKEEGEAVAGLVGRLMETARNASKSKGQFVALILFVLRLSLAEDPVGMTTRALFSGGCAGQQLEKFYDGWPLTNKREDLVASARSRGYICDILLELFVKSADFTVDEWISFYDCDTKLVHENVYVTLWDEPVVPSRLQYLISHFAYECLPYIEDARVQQVIKHLSKKYNKEIELGLADQTLDEMVKNTQSATGWQLEAYVRHLLVEKLQEVAQSDLALDFLSTSCREQASAFITNLYDQAVKSSSNEKVNDAFISILEATPPTTCREIFVKHVSNFGVTEMLRSGTFEKQSRQFLNRVVRNEAAELVTEENKLFSLAIQDAENFLSVCITEATDSGGKLGIIAKLLVNLQPVLTMKPGEDSKECLYTKRFREHFVKIRNDEKQVRNLFHLTVEISVTVPELSKNVVERVLALAVENRDDDAYLQGLLLVEQLLRQDDHDKSQRYVTWMTLVFCSLLMSQPLEPYKTCLIDLIIYVCQKSSYFPMSLIIRHIPDSLKWFFRSPESATTLLQMFCSSYRLDGLTALPQFSDKENFTCCLTETLPYLLEKQWSSLSVPDMPGCANWDEKAKVLLDTLLILSHREDLLPATLPPFVKTYVQYLDLNMESASEQELFAVLERSVSLMLKLPCTLQGCLAVIPCRIFARLMETKECIADEERDVFWKRLLVLLHAFPDIEEKISLLLKLDNCLM